MDVEKTMQFLLDQQAVFSARMDEVTVTLKEFAVNQVALGKAQLRFDKNMKRLEANQQRIQETLLHHGERSSGHEERIRRLEESEARMNAAIEHLARTVDRFLEGGSGSNGRGS